MDKAIQKMIRGFRHFRKTYFSDEPALYDQLKHGQMPSTLMIACCDSRVDPSDYEKQSGRYVRDPQCGESGSAL